MTPDLPAALTAARTAYTRLLREDRTAQACQLAEDALRLLLAAIDAQEPVAWRYRRYADQSWQRPEYSPGCRVGDGDEWQPLYAAPPAADEALAAKRETRDESSRVAVTVPVRRADLAALAAADFGRSGWSAELEQVAVMMRAALAECAQEARHAAE